MTITLTLVKIESMFHTHRAVPILKADKDTSLQELAVLVMTGNSVSYSSYSFCVPFPFFHLKRLKKPKISNNTKKQKTKISSILAYCYSLDFRDISGTHGIYTRAVEAHEPLPASMIVYSPGHHRGLNTRCPEQIPSAGGAGWC